MADYRTSADMGAVPDAFLAALEDEAMVTAEAHSRYTETDAYQSMLKSNYSLWHFMYAPPYGDQWPEDRARRPGKIHATLNVIKPAVDINARLQALVPRITLKADGLSDEQRTRAESAEKLMLEWLDMSGWDTWLSTLCRAKGLYGKGVLKVFWNSKGKRPDVRVVENPGNLRIGWGASDFSVMDWALYEYKISPQEAMIRFPGLVIEKGKDGRHLQVSDTADHYDPLSQKVTLGNSDLISRPVTYQPSDYEQKQVLVWDYWYKKPDGKGGQIVCNAMFVEGRLVKAAGAKARINEHKYLPDIPYIVIPEDTEPGNPEGISMVGGLTDLQEELNRAASHWMQLVADEIDPAWVMTGENADSVPAGLVPKGGEIIAAGASNDIHALEKGVNIFPISELVGSLWDHYHKMTGLSEILFGQVPGAQTSGRAVAIQVEAAANRLDPKRRLLYAGLKELLIFWTIMAEKMNPKMEVGIDPETGKKVMGGLKDVVNGFRRWKIVAPEITPRDIFENTQNEMNKVQGKLSSIETSMDAIGIEAPLDEIKRIMAERMNAQLFPQDVQAYVALFPIIQQMQQQQMAMQQQLAQVPPGAGPVGPQGGNVAQAQSAVNGVQQAAYAAQPGALGEDQNQPITQAGSPPPAAGQGPAQTTLIRGGQALNQLAFQSKPGAG